MKAKRPVQSQANSRRKGGSSLRQSKDAHGHHKDGANVHIELESPTSISMKNSFIIKNADPSFETYYKQMAKRKFNNNNPGSVNTSMQMGNTGMNGFSSIVNGSPVHNQT